MKSTSDKHDNIFKTIIPVSISRPFQKYIDIDSLYNVFFFFHSIQTFISGNKLNVCSTCKRSVDQQKIPLLSVHNGFSYPVIPAHLPTLNLIEQRLISPRIPFMQIRRLRHVNGQYGIYGQIINVPVQVSTMVHSLPRKMEDDYSIYVHIKKNQITRLVTYMVL